MILVCIIIILIAESAFRNYVFDNSFYYEDNFVLQYSRQFIAFLSIATLILIPWIGTLPHTLAWYFTMMWWTQFEHPSIIVSMFVMQFFMTMKISPTAKAALIYLAAQYQYLKVNKE